MASAPPLSAWARQSIYHQRRIFHDAAGHSARIMPATAHFADVRPRTASKRLNRFLNDCGIVDPRNVIHSLRHRAQDRLRAAGCPTDVRYELLGHEKKTVAAGYGVGHPLTLLKKWVDKIGF